MKTAIVPLRVKSWIKRVTNIHRQGPDPNIFVFSSARSGSTWVMEMLATQAGMKMIDEPLHPQRFRRVSEFREFRDLLPRPGRDEALSAYFDVLLQNRSGVASLHPLHRFHRLYTRRITVKILRCKDMMNWFEERFGVQIVYLIRHPIPTSLSRRYAPLGELYLQNDLYCEQFVTAEQRAYGREVLRRGDALQQTVLDWCLQNLPPLAFLDRSRWCCLHYERLVTDPEPQLHRLAACLGLSDVGAMLRRVAVASGSSRHSDRETRDRLASTGEGARRKFLVEKWRDRVTADEEHRAFEVLRAFGIRTYAEGQSMPAEPLDVQDPGPSGGRRSSGSGRGG